MKLRILLFTLLITGVFSSEMFAQKGKSSWGASASLIMPTGDFSSKTEALASTSYNRYLETTHSTGFGISAIGKYQLSDMLTMVGTVGWNTVSETLKEYETGYPEETAKKSETYKENIIFTEDGSYNFMDFTVGIRANVSFAYVEARTGYYSGDQGGFAFIPAIGAEWKNFDFQANYAIVGDSSNFGIRVGYYFF